MNDLLHILLATAVGFGTLLLTAVLAIGLVATFVIAIYKITTIKPVNGVVAFIFAHKFTTWAGIAFGILILVILVGIGSYDTGVSVLKKWN